MSCEGCKGCQGRCHKRPPQREVKKPPKPFSDVVSFIFSPFTLLVAVLQGLIVRKRMVIVRNQITKAMVIHMMRCGVRPDQIAKIIQKAKPNGL